MLEFFGRILQPLEKEGIFPFISRKSGQIFVKILSQTYLWTRRLPLNFGREFISDSEVTGV